MKKIFFPAVALAAFGAVACSDTPAPTAIAPDGMNFELVEIGKRVAKDDVNARVTLSFSIPFEVEDENGESGVMVPVAQPDGDALNFPGNQKNAGKCEAGTWKNKNGKGMGGTETSPHPHCTIYVDQGGSTVETVYVVLEPISAEYYKHNDNQWRLAFTNESGGNGKVLVKDNTQLKGNGVILAWAVFEDNPTQRVGQIEFNLGQFADENWDSDVCKVDDTPLAQISCLAQLLDFHYTPVSAEDGGWGEHGFGEAGFYEGQGFLMWEEVGSGWTRND